jgi:hypothetical protein
MSPEENSATGGPLVVVWMPFVTSGGHCRLELRTPWGRSTHTFGHDDRTGWKAIYTKTGARQSQRRGAGLERPDLPPRIATAEPLKASLRPLIPNEVVAGLCDRRR